MIEPVIYVNFGVVTIYYYLPIFGPGGETHKVACVRRINPINRSKQ